MAVDLVGLKRIKNSVIGNPSAKLALAMDDVFIHNLVQSLTRAPNDVRIEAAHVIASISYGSLPALHALLAASAPQALLFALSPLSTPTPTPAPTQPHPTSLIAALARALRALAAATADAVGPGLWGLVTHPPSAAPARAAARIALEELCGPDALDVYLPLLLPPGTATASIGPAAVSIALLLSATLRAPAHRTRVAEWLPPALRTPAPAPHSHNPAHSPSHPRRWEASAAAAEPELPGGWVATQLTRLVNSRDAKAQEAGLGGLAALARDNPIVAAGLGLVDGRDVPVALDRALVLCRGGKGGREVQIAACLCATHIIRASPPASGAQFQTQMYAGAVLATVLRLISDASEERSVRTRACFVLTFLVTDDAPLAQLATERGALAPLVELVRTLTPPPHAATDANAGAEDDDIDVEVEEEPEGASRLREAALRALAALCLLDHEPRRTLLSPSPPLGPGPGSAPAANLNPALTNPALVVPSNAATTASLALATAAAALAAGAQNQNGGGGGSGGQQTSFAPSLLLALGATHPAVRHAACHLVRVLARGVAPLRTTLVDSGLGVGVFRIMMRRIRGVEGQGPPPSATRTPTSISLSAGGGTEGWEWEERAVVGAALGAVCNAVNEFSPLRQVYIEGGLVPRLGQLLSLRPAPAGSLEDDQAMEGAGAEIGEGVGVDNEIRLGVLWTLKNLLNKSPLQLKRDVMGVLGWGLLGELLADRDTAVREQAFWVLRNLAENDAAAALVLDSMGRVPLLDALTAGLEAGSADVVLQAASAFANFANATQTARALQTHPPLARALCTVLEGHKGHSDARKPAVSGALELVRKGWRDGGVGAALRRVCDGGGERRERRESLAMALGAGMGTGGGGRGMGGEGEDREVVELARQAVEWLDSGVVDISDFAS
ncbi:ARM repeat-containing protein [Athelia psychrophila]|uniref:ARM repeat-containing protein n=1 Tax=Athelia psychrophila TaxID=1759441 RepID=A0A165XNY2_9AGAM|nr:ARM repeat-containing protein [Fibularhizoctonia sp. CBS 109695]